MSYPEYSGIPTIIGLGLEEPRATYYGKPLDEYTKDELIAIIIEMGKMQEQHSRGHIRQLRFLSN